MQRWIGWFVIAVCGVAYAQKVGNDANESILRALRTFNKAQVLYQTYGKGFACRLEQLGPPRNGAKPSAQAAGLIDEELASGQFAGYQIRLSCTPDDFQVTAVPASEGVGAVWCVDKSEVLRTADSADTCISEGKVPPRPKGVLKRVHSQIEHSGSAQTGEWIRPHIEFTWLPLFTEHKLPGCTAGCSGLYNVVPHGD